jgi:bacteriocin-like protein
MSSVNHNNLNAQEEKLREQVQSSECDVESGVTILSDEELSEVTGGSFWSSIKDVFLHGSDYGARRARMTQAWGGKTSGGQ